MPKRTNPFENSYALPQQKTRVGVKEVDRGVDFERRMIQIYDRTKKLLMNGASVYHNQTLPRDNNCVSSFHHSTLENDGKRLKQLHIGHNGKLNSQYLHTENSNGSHLMSISAIFCHFCEKMLGPEQSVYTCFMCHEQFCSLCSILMYDNDKQDCARCLTCS